MLESEIAFERSCCGTQANIVKKEEQLNEIQKMMSIMIARKQAPRPPGNMSGDERYYTNDYVGIGVGVAGRAGRSKINCMLRRLFHRH
jgi:hypothetical protein